MLEALHHYGSLNAIWDHIEYLPADWGSTPSLTPDIPASTRLIHRLIQDKKLSRSEPMQVNNIPRVATEVPTTPGISWLSRPSAPLGTVGVNNLHTIVTQWPTSAEFKPMSFRHKSNVAFTRPPHHNVCQWREAPAFHQQRLEWCLQS